MDNSFYGCAARGGASACVSSVLSNDISKGKSHTYLKAAARIDENHPYAQVDVDNANNIYISRLKDHASEALFSEVAYGRGFEFAEQMCGVYCFTDGKNTLLIENEVYWGRYCVWTVPNATFNKQHKCSWTAKSRILKSHFQNREGRSAGVLYLKNGV